MRGLYILFHDHTEFTSMITPFRLLSSTYKVECANKISLKFQQFTLEKHLNGYEALRQTNRARNQSTAARNGESTTT